MKFSKHIIGYAVVAFVALGTGAATASPEAAPAAAPVPAVTKTVPGPEVTVPIRVTETVNKEVTPAACTDAIAKADKVIAISGDAFTAASDGFMAASQFDVDALEDAASRMGDLNPKLRAALDAYGAARARCS